MTILNITINTSWLPIKGCATATPAGDWFRVRQGKLTTLVSRAYFSQLRADGSIVSSTTPTSARQ